LNNFIYHYYRTSQWSIYKT